ncbi:MAG: ABC transporter family substrate-binding protein, partial [Pseudoclavibacter sp.]
LRGSNYFLPGAPGYDEAIAQTGIATYDEVDIAGAQALLAESGVENPTVRVMTALDNDRRQQELALITDSAEQAGFTIVDGSSADWSTVLTTQTDTYDAAIFGWQSEALGFSETNPNYITGGTNNFFGWSSEELDAKMQELDVTSDEAEAQALAIEIETGLYDQAWTVPIYQFPGILAWSDQVTGVEAGFLSPNYFWNATSWAPAAG